MTDLSSLGVTSLGVWSRREALALLTAGEIDTLVRMGVWQVLWRGVYADGGVVVNAEQRAIAAVLAVGGAGQPFPVGPVNPDTGRRRRRLRAVAGGRTAARVWQLPLIDDDDPVTGACQHLIDDVLVDRSLPVQHFAGRELRPRKTRLLSTGVVRLKSGLWLTTPLRTLADCAPTLTHEALVCAMDAALHRNRVTTAELAGLSSARRGLPGGPALLDAVLRADGRAEAPTETLARLLLLPVLPDLEPQVELFDDVARLLARFDLGDRQVRLGIETDGFRNHAGDGMVAKDRRRDRASEARGWTTERLRWWELRREQDDVVRRMLQRHTELRGRRPAA